MSSFHFLDYFKIESEYVKIIEERTMPKYDCNWQLPSTEIEYDVAGQICQVCGDGIIQGDETCDDMNMIEDDGC